MKHKRIHIGLHSHHRRLRAAATSAALVLGALASAPASAVVIRAECSVLSGWVDGVGAVQATPCNEVLTYPPGDPRHAAATASSSGGVLRSSARLTFDGADTSAVAQGIAWWRQDGVVIRADDPALQGQAGRLYYSFRVDGAVDAQGAASAQLFLNNQYFNDRGTVTNSVVHEWDTPTGAGYQGPLPGENFIPFTFGEAFSIQFYLNAFVTRERGVTGPGDGWVDYAHSAYWNGIADITDAAGVSLAGFSLEVPGGFDLMAAAVPEPGAPWLLGAGLLAVGLRLRGRRAGGADTRGA